MGQRGRSIRQSEKARISCQMASPALAANIAATGAEGQFSIKYAHVAGSIAQVSLKGIRRNACPSMRAGWLAESQPCALYWGHKGGKRTAKGAVDGRLKPSSTGARWMTRRKRAPARFRGRHGIPRPHSHFPRASVVRQQAGDTTARDEYHGGVQSKTHSSPRWGESKRQAVTGDTPVA